MGVIGQTGHYGEKMSINSGVIIANQKGHISYCGIQNSPSPQCKLPSSKLHEEQ